MKTTPPACAGYCSRCGTHHYLDSGNSCSYGLEFLRRIENVASIDIETAQELRDPDLATDYLYGKARGKMFGVLECMAPDGERIFLHGFSGQYNGRWLVNGWVKPLFKVDDWYRTNDTVEKEIKQLTEKIDMTHRDDAQITQLKKTRKKLSQQLMKDIHSLYRFTNFRGETATLAQLFPDNNIPTGTGDCCGPKLLGHAVKNNLKPLSMAEFFVGKKNRSGSKAHGHFYPSCKEKCQPLIGFMLCGIEEVS